MSESTILQTQVPPLDSQQVVRFLEKHGYGCVDVQLQEHAMSGRNRLYNVQIPGETPWLVKQTQSTENSEVWFYENVAAQFGAVPRCLVADRESRIILLERLPEAQTLHKLSLSDPLSVLTLLTELADPLTRLHGLVPDDVPEACPPVPELDPVDMFLLATAGPAVGEFLKRVQARPPLGDALRRAQQKPGPKGLVHGDLKIDNIMRDSGRFYIIDWELCGYGALGWDLGALIGSVVSLWIDGLAVSETGNETDWVDRGDIPFRFLHDSVRVFMHKYMEGADAFGFTVPDRDTVAVHIAAWLVGRTWADATLALDLTSHQLLRLVVAEALANDPYQLFGDLAW